MFSTGEQMSQSCAGLVKTQTEFNLSSSIHGATLKQVPAESSLCSQSLGRLGRSTPLSSHVHASRETSLCPH
jgi:hypothetical protein